MTGTGRADPAAPDRLRGKTGNTSRSRVKELASACIPPLSTSAHHFLTCVFGLPRMSPAKAGRKTGPCPGVRYETLECLVVDHTWPRRLSERLAPSFNIPETWRTPRLTGRIPSSNSLGIQRARDTRPSHVRTTGNGREMLRAHQLAINGSAEVWLHALEPRVHVGGCHQLTQP
jgi:hypothetical protein